MKGKWPTFFYSVCVRIADGTEKLINLVDICCAKERIEEGEECC
jgi:hypothetical protein